MTEWGAYILYWGPRILYVGKGHNGAVDRWRKHKRRKWGPLVTHRQWIPANPNTERAAFQLEARLIAEHRPLANISQQRRRGRRFEQIMNQATSSDTTPTPSNLWKWWPAIPAATVTILAALALH